MRLGACADATTTAACPICRSPCVDVHVSSDAYLTHFCTHPAPSHPTLPPCPPGSASTRAARPPASASSLPPLWATARGGVSAGGRAPATLGAVESSARVFPVAAAGLQELSRLVCRSSAGWSAGAQQAGLQELSRLVCIAGAGFDVAQDVRSEGETASQANSSAAWLLFRASACRSRPTVGRGAGRPFDLWLDRHCPRLPQVRR